MCVLIAVLVFLFFSIGASIHYILTDDVAYTFKDFLSVFVVSAGVHALITCFIALIFSLFIIF